MDLIISNCQNFSLYNENEYKCISILEIFKNLNVKHLKRMSVFDMVKETENKESLLKCCCRHKEVFEVDEISMINP